MKRTPWEEHEAEILRKAGFSEGEINGWLGLGRTLNINKGRHVSQEAIKRVKRARRAKAK